MQATLVVAVLCAGRDTPVTDDELDAIGHRFNLPAEDLQDLKDTAAALFSHPEELAEAHRRALEAAQELTRDLRFNKLVSDAISRRLSKKEES